MASFVCHCVCWFQATSSLLYIYDSLYLSFSAKPFDNNLLYHLRIYTDKRNNSNLRTCSFLSKDNPVVVYVIITIVVWLGIRSKGPTGQYFLLLPCLRLELTSTRQ